MNKKLMTMGLAALMLAGCSSDDIVNDGGQGGANKGNGYVALTINMPTTTGSRAVDEYVDGDVEEYKVKDLLLILSKDGTTITKVQKFTESELSWTAGTGEITTQAVLPVVQVDDADALKVLVIANTNGLVTPNSTGDKVTVNGGTETNAISDLKAALTPTVGIGERAADKLTGTNGYFMSNAAIVNGTDDATHLFVTVTPKTSEAEAMATAADNVIYIQRAVSKVTMVPATGITNYTYTVATTGEYNGDKVQFTNWALDLTNKTFYPFQKVDTESGKANGFAAWTHERFTEGTPNRYTWAIDPNYSTTVDLSGTNPQLEHIAVADVNKGLDAALYCLENTFNLTFMKQNETTRIVLKATYTPSEYSTDTTIGTIGWFRLGESAKPYNQEDLLKEIVNTAKLFGVTCDAANVQHYTNGKKFVFDGDDNTENKVTLKLGTSNVNITSETTKNQIINALGKLTFYNQGVCYYPVRIRHFMDVTWTAGHDYTDGTAFSNVNDNTYLGRYGMVRNNWYQVSVNKVSAPGTPEMPETPDDPDDVQNYYIQATVKVLDWAVRRQSVDL